MSLLELSSFSNDSNPILARASFHIDEFIEDVAEDWGILVSVLSGSYNYFAEITVGFKVFVICNDGSIKQILKIKHEETGGITWNGDDEYFKEVRRTDTLSEKLDSIENFEENCKSEEGLENIAVQALNIIEEHL